MREDVDGRWMSCLDLGDLVSEGEKVTLVHITLSLLLL